MFETNNDVVREQAKMFSSRKAYDIFDGVTSLPLAGAQQKTSGLMSAVGMLVGKEKIPVTIELRSKADSAIAFSVRRRGLIAKKVEALDAHGKVVGTYKAKRFSMSGGFHIYDQSGAHFAEIRGKLFKAEFQFLTPAGQVMGTVSKKRGSLAKELFSSASTYSVQINEAYTNDPTAKTLMLGAAIAIDALFAASKGKGSKSKGGDDDE